MPSPSKTQARPRARLRALAAALLASAALLAAAPAAALALGEEGTLLPLPGPRAVSATPQDDPRELLVRFSGPVDAALLAGLAGRRPDWVEAVSVGYDSALIRFTRPVLATLAGDGIELAPAPPPPAAGPAAGPGAPPVPADAAERRLEILRAQVLARDGDAAGARRRLLALGAAGGEDAEAALSLADVEAGLGHPRRALDLYDRVLAREPDRDEAAFARRRLARERGPQLRADFELQSAEGADTQVIATLRGRTFLSDLVEAGATSETRRVRADELRAPDGSVGPVDATRARTEAYLSIGFDEGDALRLSLFPSSGGLGAGIGYLTRALGGETEVTADLRRPYWELLQGIVDGGRVDRVAIRHERPLAHRLTGGASARASRYGVDGAEDAGRSVGVSATLRYALVEGDPRLSVGYGLDGEYVSGVAERTDATGAAYRPLDLATREIHAVDLNAGGRFGRGWLPGLPASAEPDGPASWEAFAGWAVDRFGGSGPFLGGTLLLNAAEALDLGAQASYSAVSAGRGDGAVLRLGAFAVARF
jgi:hypothetical protein